LPAKLYHKAAHGGSRPAMVIMPSVSMLTTWSLEALAVSLASGSEASGRMPLQADITSLRRTCACTHPSAPYWQGCTSLCMHVGLVNTPHTVITAMHQAQTGVCCSTVNKCCCPLAPRKCFQKDKTFRHDGSKLNLALTVRYSAMASKMNWISFSVG